MFKRGDIFEITKGDDKGKIIAFIRPTDYDDQGNDYDNYGLMGCDKENDYYPSWDEVKHLGFDEAILQLDDAFCDNHYFVFGNPNGNGEHILMEIDKEDTECCYKFEGCYGNGDFWCPIASTLSNFNPNPTTAKTISVSKNVIMDSSGSTITETYVVVNDEETEEEEQSFLAPQPKPLL